MMDQFVIGVYKRGVLNLSLAMLEAPTHKVRTYTALVPQINAE
jgi:hypothetical protein